MTLKRESKAEGSENGVLIKTFERREKSNYIKRREKLDSTKREKNGELAMTREKDEKKRKCSVKGKTRRQMSFYVKDSEIKRAFLY